MELMFIPIAAVVADPSLRNLQANPDCVVCPAVVPQCSSDCASCLISPRTCEQCSQVIYERNCLWIFC
eukprot:snap_masked-scaffold_8-processed-gene-3.52-mRNA-1 protein AED:1.00 eAED:1.00 QI:0/0/0/0/1/1/2/0/67